MAHIKGRVRECKLRNGRVSLVMQGGHLGLTQARVTRLGGLWNTKARYAHGDSRYHRIGAHDPPSASATPCPRSLQRDKLYQFSWRPRMPSLLPPEKEAEIAKNLKAYSKRYDEEDEALLMQVGARAAVQGKDREGSFLGSGGLRGESGG